MVTLGNHGNDKTYLYKRTLYSKGPVGPGRWPDQDKLVCSAAGTAVGSVILPESKVTVKLLEVGLGASYYLVTIVTT